MVGKATLIHSCSSYLEKDWRSETRLRQWPEADSEAAPGSVVTEERSFLAKFHSRLPKGLAQVWLVSQAKESSTGMPDTISQVEVQEAGQLAVYGSLAVANPISKTAHLICKSVLNFHNPFYSSASVDWFI